MEKVDNPLFGLADRALETLEDAFPKQHRAPGLELESLMLFSALLSSSVRQFKASLQPLRAGFGHEATPIVRALFESTVALRFIFLPGDAELPKGFKADPNVRALLYYRANAKERLKVLEGLPAEQQRAFDEEDFEALRQEIADLEARLPSDLATASAKWGGYSGFNLEVLAERLDLKDQYDTLYKSMSLSSHALDMGGRPLASTSDGVSVRFDFSPSDHGVGPNLGVALALFLAALATTDETMGTSITDHLEELFEEFKALS